MKIKVLILAGGHGKRLWPKSRKNYPKQFINLGDGFSMLQSCYKRALLLTDKENIYISTILEFKSIVRQQLDSVPEKNIICEPCGKNTGPGICLSTIKIKMYEDLDSILVVLPSDQYIKGDELFTEAINNGERQVADKTGIAILGQPITSPNTNYGYIKVGEKIADQVYFVDRFIEKPDYQQAVKLLEEKQCLWNCGIIVSRLFYILQCYENLIPQMYTQISNVLTDVESKEQDERLCACYQTLVSKSFDYCILEEIKNIYVVETSFIWSDLGSYLALDYVTPPDENENILQGNIVVEEVSNSMIESKKKLIVAIGIKDVVLVDTDEILMLCSKDKVGDIPKILEELEEKKLEKFL